jgi:2-polyprenyl-3-methyl-5-hydroxy-6-metoxy-1,4-benzoquinol methylase
VNCILCGASDLNKDASLKRDQQLLVCGSCGLFIVNPVRKPNNPSQYEYSSWGMENGVLPDHVFRLKEKTMLWHLDQIKGFFEKGKILEIGSAMGSFLKVAQDQGFDVKGIEASKKACDVARSKVGDENIFNGVLENADIEPGSIEILFMSDVIEHISDPLPFLEKAFLSIKKGGIIYMTTPDPSHWSRVVFGKKWVHYKDEHVLFFSKKTFEWIADHFGLHLFDFSPVHKYANINYVSSQLNFFGYKELSHFFKLIRWVFPERLCEYLVPMSLGESRCVLYKPSNLSGTL